MHPILTAADESFLASEAELAFLLSPLRTPSDLGGRPLRTEALAVRDSALEKRGQNAPLPLLRGETRGRVESAAPVPAVAYQVKSRRERLRADVLAALQISPVIRQEP